ncbi:NuA4-domain-containing protein [Podospora conica]|nr:NuA4-domain-containing protein [Schizothecium conicum]
MATAGKPTTDAPSSNDTNSPAPAKQPLDDASKIPTDPAMKMTDNGGAAKSGSGAGDAAAAGIPFYEKRRQELKELIARKRALEKRLTLTLRTQAAEEDSIYQKETEYLETTPAGNIVVGFDNYTKGAGGNAAAARRKTGLTEANRVFSRSSVSYNANNNDAQTPASSHSTPGGSLAPTPLSTSFAGAAGGNKEAGSGAPTPTSATTAGKASGASKKKKAVAGKAAGAAAAEDSEDARDKKVRTNFGAGRK